MSRGVLEDWEMVRRLTIMKICFILFIAFVVIN